MNSDPLSAKVASYIQSRADTKLEKLEKDTNKQRKDLSDSPQGLADLEAEFKRQQQEITAKHRPDVWLSDAANRAKQISLVTHALKFTHSDAKGSSIYSQSSPEQNVGYLSSASLKEPPIDVVGNAAALDVASLLKLSDGDTTLIDCLAKGDSTALQPFAKDQEQAKEWLVGFQTVLANQKPSSHKLAKQIYFPVGSQEGYHLLAPLYSTSLSGVLHQRLMDNRFGEAMKMARKARRENKYSDQTVVTFPGLASQAFGGTKPQNISQLNSSRGGKGFLLSCRPPVWQQQLRLPVKGKQAFWREYDRRAWRTAKDLQSYLIKVRSRPSTVDIRKCRADFIDKLIEILLMYAAQIINTTNEAGWSKQAQLSLAEKYWLDPFREDDNGEFQQERQSMDWQAEIGKQFAHWLNNKLRHKKLATEDTEFDEWRKQLKQKIRLLGQDIEEMS